MFSYCGDLKRRKIDQNHNMEIMRGYEEKKASDLITTENMLLAQLKKKIVDSDFSSLVYKKHYPSQCLQKYNNKIYGLIDYFNDEKDITLLAHQEDTIQEIGKYVINYFDCIYMV